MFPTFSVTREAVTSFCATSWALFGLMSASMRALLCFTKPCSCTGRRVKSWRCHACAKGGAIFSKQMKMDSQKPGMMLT